MNDVEHTSWTRRVLADNPALLLSGLYLLASLIGLVYSWAFLREFGIDVFLYADISDFFLASLKEPFTWLLSAFAIGLVLFDNAMSRRAQRRGKRGVLRWYGSERYRRINYLVMVLLVGLFLFALALQQAEDIRGGSGTVVMLELGDGSAPQRVVLLGTTGTFLFGFDRATNRVRIHPHETILTISMQAPDKD